MPFVYPIPNAIALKTDTGLINGTTYYYVVTAFKGTSESASSNEVAATPRVVPVAPTQLVATPDKGLIRLQWTASGGAVSYVVKRSETSGGPYTRIGFVSAPETRYTDTAVKVGTTYYYVVTAVGPPKPNPPESANSNEDSAAPQAGAPLSPLQLTATAGNAQVTLEWGTIAGATDYKIKRSTGGAAYAVFPTVTASSLTRQTYVDLGLTNGTTYTYVVVALVGTNESAESNFASATPNVQMVAPSAPAKPTFSQVTWRTVLVQAPALPNGVSSLTLQQSDDGGQTYKDYASGIAGAAKTRVSPLASPWTYYFRYVAIWPGGVVNGYADSVTTVATPPSGTAPGAPGAPTIVAGSITSNSVALMAPSLPVNAFGLILQKKLKSLTDAYFQELTPYPYLSGGEVTQVSGLTASTTYQFRYVAAGSDATTAASPQNYAEVTTLAPLAQPPAAFSNPSPPYDTVLPTSIRVFVPALPARAAWLNLEGKLSDQDNALYNPMRIKMPGGGSFTLTGLSSSTAYTFRWAALNSVGSTYAPEWSVTTAAPSVTWNAGIPIACGGIAYPSSGERIQVNKSGRLTAYLASDWDWRESLAGSVLTRTAVTDPCTYTWSSVDATTNASVNFFSGAATATGQGATWTPTATGTYRIYLSVDDQNGANKTASEAGARADNGRNFNDDAQHFAITITVY